MVLTPCCTCCAPVVHLLRLAASKLTLRFRVGMPLGCGGLGLSLCRSGGIEQYGGVCRLRSSNRHQLERTLPTCEEDERPPEKPDLVEHAKSDCHSTSNGACWDRRYHASSHGHEACRRCGENNPPPVRLLLRLAAAFIARSSS